MPDLRLAAVAVVHLLTAAAFVAVGARFRARAVAPGMDQARNAFIVWWWGFALYLGLQGLADLAAVAGLASLPLVAAQRLATGPIVAAAAWGLAYHILFLWSGRAWLATPLAFYYGATGAAYSLWLLLHGPQAVVVTPWAADLVYTRPIEGLVWDLVLASVGLPLVVGSLAYLALWRKVPDRAQRYRIGLVGASILLWVVSGYTAQVLGGGIARFVAIVLLGLPTAAAVLAAYFPPARVRRWLAHGAQPPARPAPPG